MHISLKVRSVHFTDWYWMWRIKKKKIAHPWSVNAIGKKTETIGNTVLCVWRCDLICSLVVPVQLWLSLSSKRWPENHTDSIIYLSNPLLTQKQVGLCLFKHQLVGVRGLNGAQCSESHDSHPLTLWQTARTQRNSISLALVRTRPFGMGTH